MKKNRLLWLCAMLMMAVGMSSCSSDDVPGDGSGRGSDGEFVEPVNDEPEFSEGTGQNPNHESAMKTTESNGAEITRDADGGIKWISFLENSNAAPASAKDLFEKYMNLDPDVNFRLYRQETENWMEDPLTLECYQQQYKGVLVYMAGYNVRFRHGKVNDCNGLYVKIDNLDVTPAFDLQKAKEIRLFAMGSQISVWPVWQNGIRVHRCPHWPYPSDLAHLD